MARFVLVHGSFRGGWYFGPVATMLRHHGHEVWTPSLAGMGEHAHHAPLLAAAGPLPRSVWVDDVVALVTAHDLRDVVLVGHSLGGVIVAEAADRLGPMRVAMLGFLDAPVLRPGQSPADLYPETSNEPLRPAPDPGLWAPPLPVNRDEITSDETAAWMAERLSPNPVGPGIGPLTIGDAAQWHRIPRRVVFCERTPPFFPSARSRKRFDAEGTPYETLAAGHDAPVSDPSIVVQWLTSIAKVS
jgi:pimeloyl-ACP methyl ester carboxylesterase